MTTEKIKRCPFCNGKPETKSELSTVSGYASGFYAEIECRDCGATIDRGSFLIARRKKESTEESITRVTKLMEQRLEEAITTWNRRIYEC